jgi:hypothetical protein
MEPEDWAQKISKRAWTEQITQTYPDQDPEPYHYYDPSPHLTCIDTLIQWLKPGKHVKYAELKKM